MVLPVTLMNYAKFMSTGPILTIKLIIRLVELILFLNMGEAGQGALNFSKWRHDLFFNFLLNMEGPTPGGALNFGSDRMIGQTRNYSFYKLIQTTPTGWPCLSAGRCLWQARCVINRKTLTVFFDRKTQFFAWKT